MSSDSKYGKSQEKQGKSKIGLSPEAEGVICALISGIAYRSACFSRNNNCQISDRNCFNSTVSAVSHTGRQ